MTDDQARPQGQSRPQYGEMRPKPAYGEYATPEQQAAAMGKVYAPPPTTPPVVAPPPTGQPVLVRPQTDTRWNVLISTVLLAWGLFNVISGFVRPLDFSALIQAGYTQQGIGKFTATPLESKLDVVLNITNVVIFIVVLLLTYRRLRSGRPAAFIPLLGGVLAVLAIVVCFVILVQHDPAFIAYATTRSGG